MNDIVRSYDMLRCMNSRASFVSCWIVINKGMIPIEIKQNSLDNYVNDPCASQQSTKENYIKITFTSPDALALRILFSVHDPEVDILLHAIGNQLFRLASRLRSGK